MSIDDLITDTDKKHLKQLKKIVDDGWFGLKDLVTLRWALAKVLTGQTLAAACADTTAYLRHGPLPFPENQRLDALAKLGPALTAWYKVGEA